MPPIVLVWTGIGAAFAGTYYLINRAIKLDRIELEENREKAAALCQKT